MGLFKGQTGFALVRKLLVWRNATSSPRPYTLFTAACVVHRIYHFAMVGWGGFTRGCTGTGSSAGRCVRSHTRGIANKDAAKFQHCSASAVSCVGCLFGADSAADSVTAFFGDRTVGARAFAINGATCGLETIDHGAGRDPKFFVFFSRSDGNVIPVRAIKPRRTSIINLFVASICDISRLNWIVAAFRNVDE